MNPLTGLKTHLLLLVSSLLISHAYSQVVIYNVEFEQLGDSANYRPFDKGFIVMPLAGGEVDFILQFQEGSQSFFVTSPAFGEFYVTTEGNDRKGVIANASTEDTPVNFFMILGDLDTPIRAEVTSTDEATGTSTIRQESGLVPSELEGVILTADPSGAGIFDANSGAAGASQIVAKLDRVRTNTSNLQQFSVEGTIADLITGLESMGAKEFIIESVEPADGSEDTGLN